MTPAAPDPTMALVEQAWSALVAGDPAAEQAGWAEGLEVTGTAGHLPSRLPVEELAVAAVGGALLAAGALHRQRGGPTGSASVEASLEASVDREHVALAVRSERFFRHGPEPAGAGFAPLSRFWLTADGWVRTHANYPWHKQALLRALAMDDDANADAIAAAMAERRAEDVEADVFAAGGVAGAVRAREEWQRHPQGQALAAEPLVSHRVTGEATARARPAAAQPAAGIRVLDLTRVIAGPVCTRYLAALGADVLRLDPPARPDMPSGTIADTLLGKRSALLDLASTGGAETLHRLLGEADVVVCGYRPGALERLGLAEDELAERHPGLVAVYLDAWGHSGPWAGRRGFDSIVQAPTGIADTESAGSGEPGALPCQLLDHATGYLAAAAALDGLRRQAGHGGSHVRRVSLARTAWWLTSEAGGTTAHPNVGGSAAEPAAAFVAPLLSRRGPVSAVSPPGRPGTTPLSWPDMVTGYGDDPPKWPSA
jgi:crotonobetainyl-CoA:carnitine CoA-transferase CaiB-like acyl-CoA transferase